MRTPTRNFLGVTALAALCAAPSVAMAADIEVIHWWTSKGESAAVSRVRQGARQ